MKDVPAAHADSSHFSEEQLTAKSVYRGNARASSRAVDWTVDDCVRLVGATAGLAGWLAAAAAAVPALAASDEAKETIARALAEAGQARTWNLMIDVIAQTGRYAPGTASVTDANKFTVEGEKRYWLHIALDRDDGTVLGTQLEEVIE